MRAVSFKWHIDLEWEMVGFGETHVGPVGDCAAW